MSLKGDVFGTFKTTVLECIVAIVVAATGAACVVIPFELAYHMTQWVIRRW